MSATQVGAKSATHMVIQMRIQRPPLVWVQLDPSLYDRVRGGFSPPLVWLT